MKRGDPAVPVVAGQGYGHGGFAVGEEATANTLLARAGQTKVAVCAVTRKKQREIGRPRVQRSRGTDGK